MGFQGDRRHARAQELRASSSARHDLWVEVLGDLDVDDRGPPVTPRSNMLYVHRSGAGPGRTIEYFYIHNLLPLITTLRATVEGMSTRLHKSSSMFMLV
jgi:hypothetical protein